MEQFKNAVYPLNEVTDAARIILRVLKEAEASPQSRIQALHNVYALAD